MKMNDRSLIRELRDEADLCRNEGVEELADLLDCAARRIEWLISLSDCHGPDWTQRDTEYLK